MPHGVITLVDKCPQVSLSCSPHMKTNKRLAGPRRSVHANLTSGNHARLLRHAEASNLSASKYAGVAVDFLLDLEEAFGGPLTEQFRRMLVGSANKAQVALKKLLA